MYGIGVDLFSPPSNNCVGEPVCRRFENRGNHRRAVIVGSQTFVVIDPAIGKKFTEISMNSMARGSAWENFMPSS